VKRQAGKRVRADEKGRGGRFGTAAGGAVDALAFADRTIAESIVRDRKRVGLSQRELAERAGIGVEVLKRAERGVVVASVRTLTKIEEALVGAGLQRGAR
jgi:ribosome-binding protein aMBF1 (putative translation factor)